MLCECREKFSVEFANFFMRLVPLVAIPPLSLALVRVSFMAFHTSDSQLTRVVVKKMIYHWACSLCPISQNSNCNG